MFQRIGVATAEMQLPIANVRRLYNVFGERCEIREELACDRQEMEQQLYVSLDGDGT